MQVLPFTGKLTIVGGTTMRHGPNRAIALSIILSVLIVMSSIPLPAVARFGDEVAMTAAAAQEALGIAGDEKGAEEAAEPKKDETQATDDQQTAAPKEDTEQAEADKAQADKSEDDAGAPAQESAVVTDEGSAQEQDTSQDEKAPDDAKGAAQAQSATDQATTPQAPETPQQSETPNMPMLSPQADYSLADFLVSEESTIEYSKDGGGSWSSYTEGTGVAFGDRVRVRLGWAIPNKMTVNAGDTFTYTLPNSDPEVINYLRATGNVMNGSTVDGTYEIDGQTLTIRYTSDEGSNVHGNISFEGMLEGTTEERTNGATKTVIFPGRVSSIELDIAPAASGIQLAKWYNHNEETSDTWHYVIMVKTSGKNENLHLSDVMGDLFELEGSNVSVTYDQEGTNPVPGATVTGAGSGSRSFDVRIPSTQDGQTFYVSYDAKADPEYVGLAHAAGKYDRIKNIASATSNQVPEPVKGESTAYVGNSWTVSKTAASDVEAKTITWTILIDAGNLGDASLAPVKDVLGTNLDEPTSITIEESTDGSTWGPSSASFGWDEMVAGTAKLPANAKGKKYRITYTTHYTDESVYGGTYKNTVSVVPHNNPDYTQTSEARIVVGNVDTKGTVQKKVLSTELTSTPQWLSTIHAESNLTGLIFYDSTDGKHSINLDSVGVFTNEDCTTRYTGDFDVDLARGQLMVGFYDTIPAGTNIYIRYTTTLNGNAVTVEGDRSVVNVTNESKIVYDGIISDHKDTATYRQSTHMTKGFVTDNKDGGGLFTWELELGPLPSNARTVSIVDYLPENHSFRADTLKAVDNPYYVSGSYDGLTAVDNGDGTVTITVTGTALQVARERMVHIVYSTQWKDISIVRPGRVENNAQLTINDNTEPVVQAVKWGTPPNVLTKGYAYNATTAPRATYTIKVNESGIELNGGKTITLEDTIGSALEFVLGSIKIDGVPITSLASRGYSYSYDAETRTISIRMPDKTPAVVTYEAYVKLKPGDSLDDSNAVNNVSLVGEVAASREATSTINATVLEPMATTSSDYNQLIMYKHREGSITTGLSGATFRVEKLDVVRSGYRWSVSGVTNVGTATSATNGYTPMIGGLLSDTIYRIVETSAPPGYAAAKPTYVVFPGADGINYSRVLVDGNSVQALEDVQTGIVYIADEPSTQYASVPLSATKTISGRPFCVNDSFTFDVAASTAGAPLPKDEDGATVSSRTIQPGSGTSASVDLGTITFSSDDLGTADSKMFVYTVTERAGTAGGMSYDTTARTVAVTLSRDTDGSLVTSVSYRKGEEVESGLTFNNVYSSVGVNASANITKTLAGRPLRGGEFAFILTPYGKSTPIVGYGENAADGTITLTHPLTDGAGRTYTLDALADVPCNADGSRSKTFSYTVSEVTGALSDEQLASLSEAQRANLVGKRILPAGITSTVTTGSFTINVRDDGQGHMSAECSCGATMTPVGGTATTTGTPLNLKNSYRPESTTVSLSGTKTLSADAGITPPAMAGLAGKFAFTISSDDSFAPLPDVTTVTNAAGGSVSFGDITYAASDITSASWGADGKRTREFTYKIKETRAPAGFAKDDDKTVKVELTDDGNGQLSAKVVEPEPPAVNFTFNNKYTPAPTKATIEATKVVTTPDGVPDLKMDAKDFTFVLTAADAATPMPSDATGTTAKADNKGSGTAIDTATFGAITYDKPGTYTYTLTEQGTNATTGAALPGFTYDTTSYDVTVTVTDDGAGKLSAAVTYKRGETVVDKPVFTNTYEPTQVSIPLHGLKKITGVGNASASDEPKLQDLIDAGYTFTLTGKDGAPLPDGTTGATATGAFTHPDGADELTGAIDFGSITFEASDMAGAKIASGEMVKDFTYTITEHEPTDSSKVISGLDGSVSVQVTIRVTDNLTGALRAEVVKAASAENSFVVSDLYSGAYVVLTGSKAMTGRDFQNGDEFTFDISRITEGAPRLVNAQGDEHDTITIKPVEGASAQLDFGAAVFTGAALEEDGSRDYVYRLSEHSGSVPGVTYDSSSFYAKVTLTRDDGSFVASVKYYSDEACTTEVSSPVFTNTYKAGSATASLHASKAIEPSKPLMVPPLPGAGDYSMTLTAGTDQTPMPNNTKGGSVTKGIDDLMSVDFGTISYGAAGTYEYTIAEQAGSIAGMSYDTTVHTARVVVADDGSGTLSAKVAYDGDATGPAPVFTNTYTAAPASISLGANKVLQRRTLRADEFSFTLRSEEGGLIQTAKNDAEGKVSFDALSFDEPGTYTYTIAEVQGTEDHMDFDAARHTAKVTVTDDSTGKLSASVTYDDDPALAAPTFTNTYRPEDTSVMFEGIKSFNGESSAGFTFYAEGPGYDEEGNLKPEVVVSQGATDFNGALTMSPITYSLDQLIAMREAGYLTFTPGETVDTYTIYYYVLEDGVEKDLPSRGIQPVRDAQLISVSIADDGQTLTPTIDYGEFGRLSFVNVYAPNSPQLSLVGSKALVSSGSEEGMPTVYDIAGAYSFTISSDDPDAPLPMLEGEVMATMSSDTNGQIAFFPITFDIGLLSGQPWDSEGMRKRSFTYTIREELSEDVPESYKDFTDCITCDDDQTVTVTLMDNGSGALLAVVDGSASDPRVPHDDENPIVLPDFTFTNVWDPEGPTTPVAPPESPSTSVTPTTPTTPSTPSTPDSPESPLTPSVPEEDTPTGGSTTPSGGSPSSGSQRSQGNSGFAASTFAESKLPKTSDVFAGWLAAVVGALALAGVAAIAASILLRRRRDGQDR